MHIHFQIKLYMSPLPYSEESKKMYGQKVAVAICHSTHFFFSKLKISMSVH